jgi:phosphoadenosine phosphosulfate reductase
MNAISASEERARKLHERYAQLDGYELLRVMIEEEFPGQIAVSSSFGSESVVVLDMVSRIDRATPIIFLDTGKLFDETLTYRERVISQLGLSEVRTVRPQENDLERWDTDGNLWQSDADSCCHIRRVLPLDQILHSFDAWITGRKGYHGKSRVSLETIEAVDGKVKINPLARWSRERVEATIDARALPRHPLVSRGYASIGCWPCTRAVAPGEGIRSGRWHGSEKTECGIHRARWANSDGDRPSDRIQQRPVIPLSLKRDEISEEDTRERGTTVHSARR